MRNRNYSNLRFFSKMSSLEFNSAIKTGLVITSALKTDPKVSIFSNVVTFGLTFLASTELAKEWPLPDILLRTFVKSGSPVD